MAKYQVGLIAKNKALLKNKRWYNQRFDGCLNLIWMISEAEIQAESRKMLGGNFTSHICVFENHRVDWYIDLLDIQRVTKLFLRQAKAKPHFSRSLIKKWEADSRNFSRQTTKLDKLNLKKLSSQELAKLYQNFTKIYNQTITSSSLIDGFALGSDEIIQTEINKLLEARQIIKGRGEIFSILTAPTHQSFINEAELALLRLALKIKSFKTLVAALTQPAIKKLLAEQTKKYFWIKNNYHDNYVLSDRDFLKDIKALLASSLDIKNEISRIAGTPLKNKRAKQKLISKLKPTAYLKNLLEISEDFTDWQDQRKKRTFLFTNYASLLLEEIGRRSGHTLGQMKYLARAEVLELLAGREFKSSELEQRISQTFIYQKGNCYEILSGPAAAKMIADILVKTDHSAIQDFRGLTASIGQVRGRAKIVTSVKDIDKVKTGDILVAVMTRPDYIMGIKKAAAIVTDEGGITCHAAIISRELGIPCIIGTKIGTKILQDGDLIEVNANHGWVRKVQ